MGLCSPVLCGLEPMNASYKIVATHGTNVFPTRFERKFSSYLSAKKIKKKSFTFTYG